MSLPPYLWGAGARAVGLQLPNIDKIRCTECRRWTRLPAFYELDRVLCEKCNRPRVEKARTWAGVAA